LNNLKLLIEKIGPPRRRTKKARGKLVEVFLFVIFVCFVVEQPEPADPKDR